MVWLVRISYAGGCILISYRPFLKDSPLAEPIASPGLGRGLRNGGIAACFVLARG